MNHKLDTIPGQAVYSPLTLKIYNFIVLTISNKFAWKCTTKTQLEFFNQNITNCHMDVGVGSGYYIDHCKFPNPNNIQLTLMDLNASCLQYCADKLKRYSPKLIQRDILQPFKDSNKYDSISLNYVLHCLPGNLDDKEIVFCNFKKLLNPQGVIFGSTILGSKIKPNWLATKLLKLYNNKQIFCNTEDNKNDLYKVLQKNFNQVEIIQIGLVALFKASQPKI